MGLDNASIAMKTRLSQPQEAIVEHGLGPALVLAGAGSGKTTTIIHRVARMLAKGIAHNRILLLTFSRAAANEMSVRLQNLMPGDRRASRLRIETFHSWCFRFLREHPILCGRRDGMTVADESDTRAIYRRVAKSLGIATSEKFGRKFVKDVSEFYSLCKNWGITAANSPERIKEGLRTRLDIDELDADLALRLLLGYESELIRQNALDFDDLCLHARHIMRTNPEITRELSRRHEYILVDEAQDTNRIQYELVQLLASNHRNLAMVADDRQAIYFFRGARVENLKQFIRDFKPRVYLLQENYRSTSAIVDASNRLIAHNKSQLPAKPHSVRREGRDPYLVCSHTGHDMAERLATRVLDLIADGVSPGDIGILYRTNRMARWAEMAMRSCGIRYRIAGGISIFETLEAKAAIAAGRLLANPRDTSALAALSEFVDGLSTATVERIAGLMRDAPDDFDVWSAATQLGGAAARICSTIFCRLENLASAGPDAAGSWVISEDGLDLPGFYERKIARSPSNKTVLERELEKRSSNLLALDEGTRKALIRSARLVAPDEAESPDDYSLHLSEAERWNVLLEARLDDREERSSDAADQKIELSTAHKSKGKEYGYLFVLGWSEGLFPLGRQSDSEDGEVSDVFVTASVEEERRLAYVALTRAKHNCELHHADDLAPFGPSGLSPSRFWREMNPTLDDVDEQIVSAGSRAAA